jgi:hypothetical protein
LHKAPAALGFGTFLHHEGLSKIRIAKHLVVIFNFIENELIALGLYYHMSIICHYWLLCSVEIQYHS